ncbi:MAG: hypothetical protein ABI405_14510, partial [Parafilimonas sp.]
KKIYINDNREIITTAFLGESGQERYELNIKFGQKALNRYARDLDITECIPGLTEDNWYEIDVVNRKILVYLF